MRNIFLLLALSLASTCHAQEGNTITIPFSGATPTTCAFPQVYYNTGTGVFYDCVLGTPTARTNGGGGSGTVTSITFSAPLTGSTITTSGTVGVTCGAGQVMAGATPACTATPTLGASGTLGSLALGNATSGLLTLQTATGAITSYTIDLPVAQPSGSNTFLSCTAASPAVCTWVAGAGAPSLDTVTGAAAQATGTETATGHNYSFAGVETTANLDFPFAFTNANSTNNNTTGALFAGSSGTGTGGLSAVFACMGSTSAGNDCIRQYNGGSVSNGTYTPGTLEFHVTQGGAAIAIGGFQAGNNSGIEGNATGGTVINQGGTDAGVNSAVGSITTRGGDQTGAGGSSSKGGNNIVRGGNNAGTNTASMGGSLWLSAGQSTGATTGVQGLISMAGSEVGASTPVQWQLMCPSSTTAMTITNCGASPGNWMGVAETVNAVTTVYIFGGYTLVIASAAVTVGDTVCASTTAGKVTDSGGTTACAVGSQVGIVRAVSGTFQLGDGTAVTPTTTLPLILIARD